MDQRKEKTGSPVKLRQLERQRRIEQAVAQGQSTEQVLAQEGISRRTFERDKQSIICKTSSVYDPLDVGEVWNESKTKFQDYETRARKIIESQEEAEKAIRNYESVKQVALETKSRCKIPKPIIVPNYNTMLRALEFLLYVEKTRIIIGQEIGAIPKSTSGFGPNWKIPELPGGGNGGGKIAERIEKLPPQKRMKVIARLREISREVKIMKEGE